MTAQRAQLAAEDAALTLEPPKPPKKPPRKPAPPADDDPGPPVPMSPELRALQRRMEDAERDASPKKGPKR